MRCLSVQSKDYKKKRNCKLPGAPNVLSPIAAYRLGLILCAIVLLVLPLLLPGGCFLPGTLHRPPRLVSACLFPDALTFAGHSEVHCSSMGPRMPSQCPCAPGAGCQWTQKQATEIHNKYWLKWVLLWLD
jgi:hypothetical protein